MWKIGIVFMLLIGACGYEQEAKDFDKSVEIGRCPIMMDAGGERMGLYPFWYMKGSRPDVTKSVSDNIYASCIAFPEFQMYHYGYPAYGTSESNVVAQWLFDESSGNIIDEVGGMTLIVQPSGTGLTYGTVATGVYAGLTPGIEFYDSSYTNGGMFESTNPEQLNFGLNDFVVESWFSVGANPGIEEQPAVLFLALGFSVPVHAVSLYLDFFTMTATVGLLPGNLTAVGTIPDIRGDGKLHKLRASGVRNGNMTLELDDDEIAAVDISSLAATSLAFGTQAIVGQNHVGGINELRITVGNATNNSTPIWYP